MEEAKKGPGRPRKYAGKRPTWTIRLEAPIGERVKQMAEAAGLSISEVCERQILRSFDLEADKERLEERLFEMQVAERKRIETEAKTMQEAVKRSEERLADIQAKLAALTAKVGI